MMWRDKQSGSNQQDEDDSWMISYADVITLLLAFFVLLFSMSTVNQSQYEKVKNGIMEQLSNTTSDQPFNIVFGDFSVILRDLIKKGQVEVKQTQTGITLEFASELLYKSGSAKLRSTAHPVLLKIASAIKKMRYKELKISVEGHTDDAPIHSKLFPSNWELSLNRATHVVRFFIQQGISKSHFKAVAFADTHPKVPNRDELGQPIPENRAKNRRVTIQLNRI